MNSVILCLLFAASAQPSALPQSQVLKASSGASSAFEIEIDTHGRVVRAQARNTTLGDVAKRLEVLLKVPVKVSSALARNRITFSKLEGVPLTELLARLAPAPFVDSREALGKNPQLLAVHLLESSEAAPPVNEAAGIVIEGTMEEPVDEGGATGSTGGGPKPGSRVATPVLPEEGPFLVVRRLPDGRLSIDARDQGLGVLLFEVAQAYGARFDLRISEAPVVGRISVNGILPSELPGLLAISGVGVDVRRNLLTGEETVLRYFVDAAP